MSSLHPGLTRDEFDERVAAADRHLDRPLYPVWGLAGVGMVAFTVTLFVGEHRAPEWIVNLSVMMMVGFSTVAIAVRLVRAGPALRRFGLLCAVCECPLHGEETTANKAHVRRTGCCRRCGAPVLRDHPGAHEAAARESAVSRGAPHASAFSRDEFERLRAGWRKRMSRRLSVLIASGLAGPLLTMLIVTSIDMPRRVMLGVVGAGMSVFPLVAVWVLASGRSMWRRVGLECPACRRMPMPDGDLSVLRTGACPHCSAVILRPSGESG